MTPASRTERDLPSTLTAAIATGLSKSVKDHPVEIAAIRRDKERHFAAWDSIISTRLSYGSIFGWMAR